MARHLALPSAVQSPWLQRVVPLGSLRARAFSSVANLPERTLPRYLQSRKPGSSLLSLKWPRPPRNLLLVLKDGSAGIAKPAAEFCSYIHAEFPCVNIILEPDIADNVRDEIGALPVHIPDSMCDVGDKVDVMATFGGDGTVLRAASFFKLQGSVPPILPFSMGTLGFLGEWNFADYKRAWREMYMSGSDVPGSAPALRGAKGKSQGAQASRILLRHRIRADILDPRGNNLNRHVFDALDSEVKSGMAGSDEASPSMRAVNEILVHRGSHPHLAKIGIYQNGHWLTETMADGILVSTPTGSTAYSLSAGGPIVHPLVRSLLITPVSPCSLSFRSLVLPLDINVCLRMSVSNRASELDLSIDGKRCAGLPPGSEVHIEGEFVGRAGPGEEWHGGVPCVVRADGDPWVGGLNGLLKFNFPFGKELRSDK